MIHLGLTKPTKALIIGEYISSHDVTKTVVLSPAKFTFSAGIDSVEFVDWPEIIMYRTFYRLLQEIDARTLVVVNECLRTRNRHDLTYNCIRHFLAQAGHVLVFQWLPCIGDMQDFMTLFDFDTGSRWKREQFDVDLLGECTVAFTPRSPNLSRIDVSTSVRTKEVYTREKRKLIDGIGLKDPHTIPRNLYMLSGKDKLDHVGSQWHLGRNNRFKLPRMQTYKELVYDNAPYVVFEFPHNFIDLADSLCLAEQMDVPVLVSDLKVDQWYFTRYTQWTERIRDGYASLSAWAKRP